MLIRRDHGPSYETPNAVMRTLAAPSLGADELSVWEVSMRAGQRGPIHAVDREQVWCVLAGRLDVQLADETVTADAGDAIRLPAGIDRQVSAATDARAIVASGAAPVVTSAEGSRPLPWGT